MPNIVSPRGKEGKQKMVPHPGFFWQFPEHKLSLHRELLVTFSKYAITIINKRDCIRN